MQAFVLAAGLGTRLKPLTNNKPKALVEVNGQPLLKITIDKLIKQKVTRIVVNVHHFADDICHYLDSLKWDAEILISDERQQLLDTGGGLKHAASLFGKNEPILIHNVDILSHIDFGEALAYHSYSKNIATLFVSNRKTTRYLLFDNNRQLIGWEDIKSGEKKWSNHPTSEYTPLAFSGISIIQPELTDLLPEEVHPYPIIPAYLEIAKTHRIRDFIHNSNDWLDVGKPETLAQAQQWILS
ncbi:MAG: nucleotidyltransferase family protein [Bacteroidales bacterium]|nr:nucleotidyltransferase family protein [Bacteroidales bacterium]